MGTLRAFSVGNIKEQFGLEHYIETGTGSGECLAFAIQYRFKSYASVEVHPELAAQATEKFKQVESCRIFQGKSADNLPLMLADTFKTKNLEPCLFFMDAHFPGADFGFAAYDAEPDIKIRIPLEEELRLICKLRDTYRDVFICDDLRIYQDGDYQDGNWPAREKLGADGIGFIYELFSATHDITLFNLHQGYIVITPKKITAYK